MISKWLWRLLFICGTVFIIACLFLLNNLLTLSTHSNRVEGTVIKLEESIFEWQDHDSLTKKYSKHYKPVVEFKLVNGGTVHFTSGAGSNPPMFHIGQKIEVMYDINDPNKAEINTFWSLWGLPLILFIIGALLILFSLVIRNIVLK